MCCSEKYDAYKYVEIELINFIKLLDLVWFSAERISGNIHNHKVFHSYVFEHVVLNEIAGSNA